MDSVAAPSMQQAFADAKVEHSEQEHALAPEVSTDQTPVPPAQHTDKTAGVPSTTVDTDLISDTDWASLQEAFKGDASKQRAELNRVFTQKTQALSAERKRLARLEPHADLIDAYETDPTGTLRQLADQHGLVISTRTEKPAAPPTTAENRFHALAKAKLGPDLDFLAGPIGDLLQEVTGGMQTELDALKGQTQTIVSNASQAEVDGYLKAFEKSHPDWKEHEPAMLKLGLQPSPGMSATDFLEACYTLVTHKAQLEKAGADAVKRLSEAAEKADKDTHAVPQKQVTPTAPKKATMHDAFAAAKRGETWA